MLIDSHCHLPDNPEKIIKGAQAEGVTGFINIGTNLQNSKTAIRIATQFDCVFTTVGIYPHENRTTPLDELESKLRELVQNNKKVIGIGECGLDITNWENGTPIDEQLKLFEMQLKLALENNLPIVLHNRNGDDLALQTIKKFPGLIGVAHCFASDVETAKKFMDLGWYLSFSGMITYPARKPLLEAVKYVPNDRFLVETDTPYLPPQGHRGEVNQPKYVKMVADKIAEVKNLPIATICNLSYGNTCRIFNLKYVY